MNSHFEKILNYDILKENILNKRFDIVVSNPPYIRNSEKELMTKNVNYLQKPFSGKELMIKVRGILDK